MYMNSMHSQGLQPATQD